jgi:hypothetical protein
MGNWQYAASPDAVRELLRGGGEFNEPERILSDLTEAQAFAQPPGAPHSIAQILAHTHYCQQATLGGLRGEDWPQPEHLEDTFAPPPAGTWAAMVTDFLSDIQACAALAAERADATSPQQDDTSLCYDLAESALHNAYHLGQIVLLRQILGLWPPAGGDVNDF